MRFTILTFLALCLAFGPVTSPAAEIPQADPDNGLVVFYRLKSFKGSAIRFNVQYAQGTVGQLGNGTFLYKNFEPGQYQFWSQVISQDSITLTIEAGKTYYVKGDVQIGIYAGRPKFTLMSESQAKADLSKF